MEEKRSVERRFAEIFLGEPEPPLTTEMVSDWGLGMGNGYMGPRESRRGGWRLYNNPDHEAMHREIDRYRRDNDVPRVIFEEKDWEGTPEEIRQGLRELMDGLEEIPKARWYPKPFGSDLDLLLSTVEREASPWYLCWELTYAPQTHYSPHEERGTYTARVFSMATTRIDPSDVESERVPLYEAHCKGNDMVPTLCEAFTRMVETHGDIWRYR